MAQEPTTWILTGSPENFAATREHFQGQLRTVTESDAEQLVDRMRAAAGVLA